MSTMYALFEMQGGSSPTDTTRAFARLRGCPQNFHAEDLVANSQENIMASSHSTAPKDIAANVV